MSVHVNLQRVNKLETLYGRSRLYVKVELYVWPNRPSYIALISFININFTCVGKEKFSDIGILPNYIFNLTGFFCTVSGKIDVDMADFTLR